MADEGFKRKLTAILSADVEGYSRLMGDDEEATVRTLTAYREVLSTLIQQHNGVVLDSPGDNLLAEFVSVVDAVQCAVAVQKEINARNEGLSENRRMQFRIGINLGDVIQEEERIYGDGVNIAARLEGLAESGGICISKTAFDQIESKLPYGYEFLGDQSVKNIAKPVGAYRVLMEPRVTVAGEPEKEKRSSVRRKTIIAGAVAVLLLAIAVGIFMFLTKPWAPEFEPTSEAEMALPLPDKPSIAVLPLANMSDDPKQEYFVDGMTEDLITDLSKLSGVFVIARNSVFTYKGKPVKVQRVAEELGVRYVLEGSVRRAGDQVRISAQLIDATTGGHLWAERYDGKVDNVFDLQDEITGKIIASLTLHLTPDERKSIERPETTNVAAYDAYLQGWEHLQRHTAEEFAKALPYLKNAIELDSGYGQAYAALAWLYYQTYGRHWHKALDLPGRPEALHQANRYLEMATKYSTPLAHRVTADKMWQIEHKFDEAILEAKRAVALDSGDPVSHTGLARALTHAGRAEEAIDPMKTAMRLDPHYPPYYLTILGIAYFTAEQFEESIDVLERALDRNPDFIFSTLPLMAAYAQLGRLQEAKAALAKFENVMGKASIQGIAPHWPFKHPSDADRFLNGLRKAGVTEMRQ